MTKVTAMPMPTAVSTFLETPRKGQHAQELGEDEVVRQDCAQRNRKQLVRFPLFALLLILLRAGPAPTAWQRSGRPSTRKPPTGSVSMPDTVIRGDDLDAVAAVEHAAAEGAVAQELADDAHGQQHQV